MKRRMIGLVLALVLACSIVGGTCLAEAEDSGDGSGLVTFDANLTNIMEKQAKEWIATDDNRAMATVLLTMDLIIAIDGDGLDITGLTKTSFIGKDELDILVYVHGDENDFLIYYRPINGMAGYVRREAAGDDVIQLVFDEVCEDGAYKNDMESIYGVVQTIQSLMEDGEE